MSGKYQIELDGRRIYVNYLVKDLERAKEFYQDIFGFNFRYFETKYGERWYYCPLPPKGASLALLEVAEDIFKPSTSVLTLLVKRIEEVKEYLESRDIECSDLLELSENLQVFRITDTEGNYINIMEDKE
ncbi:MAG: VOC family protein [Candidatus Odinarchaeota archaeon]